MDERRAVAMVVRSLVDAWNRGDPQGSRTKGDRRAGQAGPGSQVAVTSGPVIEVKKGSATVRFGWVARARGAEGRGGTIHCGLGCYGTRWLIEVLRNDEEDGQGTRVL